MYLQPRYGGVDLDESVREGFGAVQEEQDGWNGFGKQSIASIDKKNYLTQTQHVFLRPLLSRHPEQTADPVEVVPFQIPPRLLRPVLPRVLLHPLAAHPPSIPRRARRLAERWPLVYDHKLCLKLVRDYKIRSRSVHRVESK